MSNRASSTDIGFTGTRPIGTITGPSVSSGASGAGAPRAAPPDRRGESRMARRLRPRAIFS